MKISVQSFNGVAPKVNPRYLGEGGAQISSNVEAIGRSLRPLFGLGSALSSVTVASNAATIYRYGQDAANENQYWFAWTSDVDVCRGQVSGDTEEWTFYTGDGAPKATYNAIRGADPTLAAGEYRPLGLPFPTTPLAAAAGGVNADEEPALVTLNPSVVQQIGLEYGLHFSVDGQQSWMTLDMSRYNLVAESSDYTKWRTNYFNSVTLTQNAITAPDGTNTAAKMQRINVSYNAIGVALAAMTVGATYTWSIYVKGLNATRSVFRINRLAPTPITETAVLKVNWSAGVPSLHSLSNGTHTISAVGNGWYRLSVTFTLPETFTVETLPLHFYVQPQDGGSSTEGIYVWGAQVERGSAATPYIETQGGIGQTVTPWAIADAFLAFSSFATAAVVGSNTVTVTSIDTGDDAKLAVRYGSGETTLIGGVGAATGTNGTAPECYMPYTSDGAELRQIWLSTAESGGYVNVPVTVPATIGFGTPIDWVSAINAAAISNITATDAGAFIKLTRTTTGRTSRINVKARYYKPPVTDTVTPNVWESTSTPAIDKIVYFRATGSDVGAATATPATCTITSTLLGKLPQNSKAQYRTAIGGTYSDVYLDDTSPSAVAAAFDAKADLTAVVTAAAVTVSTTATGVNAFLEIKWPIENDAVITGEGVTLELGTKETRTYVYTWVNTEGGLTMESAPSDASNEVEVYPNQTVQLTSFPSAVVSGFLSDNLTVRIYRTTTDTYLFVAELALVAAAAWSASGDFTVGTIATKVFFAGTDAEETRYYRCIKPTGAGAGDAAEVTDTTYWTRISGVVSTTTGWTDTVRADSLGEECPSVLWTPPPETLSGLTNLPNGMMAGFVGRDVYFCEPYRPYAWPENYILSLDAPIVGLAAVDTTLCALTKESPYFIQGTAPALMTQVRADVAQACVSKRSIASMGGVVFYASPDGLVMLAPSGSKIVTEERFSRAQWQELNPSSIHGYGHDAKYFGFFTGADNVNNAWIPAANGGFVFDTKTGEFYLHSTSSLAGYADPRNDTLYLTDSTTIKAWEGGATRALGRWRSKVFTMPRETFFSCVQLEADSYGSAGDVQLQIRRDGVNVFASAQNITSRRPIRLPATAVGRDWEIDITSRCEVFNVIMAQSMAELADG
jgi:hypothetical protein